jgi:aspartyl-tRNA(Asn)/glutamyl-tRNA(Gln) amidotransferase subunit B
LSQNGELSSTNAKAIFRELVSEKTIPDVAKYATEKGYIQVNDEAEMEAVVDDMLEDPVAKPAVEAFKAGNEKVIGFLIGQVMQKSGGRANPSKVQEIIRRKIFASDDAK